MKKALVSGGAGFLGSAIIRQLAARGIQLVVVDKNENKALEALGVDFRLGDINDKNFLKDACRGCDTVFHVAARKGDWGPRKEFLTVNVEGTRNVIEVCLRNGVRNLVYTSTAKVFFDGNDICGVNESTAYPANIKSPYCQTKMIAEQLVLAANSEQLRTTALRPNLIWGPGDPFFIPDLVKQGALGRLRKIGDGHNLVDFCYVENAAAAHLLAADNLEQSGKAAGEAYFVSQGEPVILWNWINKLFRHLELQPVENEISFRKAYLTGFTLEWIHKLLRLQKEPRLTRFRVEVLARSQWFSIAKAKRDLRYHPVVSTAEGLLRTVEWIWNAE
jgi:nucleoside-diphosphate-sugar epimerase